MTSHVRHRRSTIATDPLPAGMEVGEIAVNIANRQLAVGNATGQPLALLAVRYFDINTKYAAGDFVVNAGKLYFSKVATGPGAFDITKWTIASNDPNDPADLSNYLQLTGGTMTGALTLAGPPVGTLEAVTKAYVDGKVPPTPNAGQIAFTPGGTVAATNVQAAIAEVAAEKLAIAGGTMTGALTLSAVAPGVSDAVKKSYVDAADTTLTTNANSRVSKAGDTMVGELVVNADIQANRTATTGIIFLGSNKQHYLYFDGTNYNMPAGPLTVGGALNASAGTFGGMVTANAGLTIPFAQALQVNTQAYFGSATGSNFLVQGVTNSPYPTISFHAPGYFAANFGMNIDGNFYIGGWSFGEGNYFKVLTTRDGAPVTSHRMVYVGDYTHSWLLPDAGGLVEPFGRNASVTGMSAPSDDRGYRLITARYAQHQMMINGGWVAVGGA